MKTVVITSQKGGSGKTTVAAHLAVAAEQSGHGSAVLIDTDPQQTLATWWKVREAEAPKLAPVTVRELPAKLATLREMSFAWCFIDTPPALTEQNRQVLGLADIVRLSRRGQARTTSGPWARLLTWSSNLARPSSSCSRRPRVMPASPCRPWAALSWHGKVFEAVVHDRVDYAASMTDGRTALEIAPAGPAAAETAQLWSLLRAHLDALANMRELANTDKSVINV